jgi:murein DD-endopeptidase MepM/ murein hydrolase activator NlpD
MTTDSTAHRNNFNNSLPCYSHAPMNTLTLKGIAFLNCNSQRHEHHWPIVAFCSAILISTLFISTKYINEAQANLPLSKTDTLRIASLINHHPDQPFPSKFPLNDQWLFSAEQPPLTMLMPSIDKFSLNQSASTQATEPNGALTSQTSLDMSAIGPQTQQVTVREGDTLAKIFKRLNLPSTTLLAVNHASPNNQLLFNIKAGDKFEVEFDANRQLSRLVIPKNLTESVAFLLQKNASYRTETIKKPVQSVQHLAEGVIENSFYIAAQKTGLTDELIMKLVEVFTWDIDFSQDIHRGDHFEVLYEQKKIGNQTLNAQILAARFTTQGRQTTAIAFTDHNGETRFYNPQGMGIKKPFKRNPVDFARISSHFNSQRYHPILHTMRAHKGVDYAAKTGTPVKAAGDGKVIFAGRKGGYGNTVVIQHGQNITTLYGHLHKFAAKLKVGDRVKQDQVIGQVGSSGLATGPHLHYEFMVNGVNKNPMTVALTVSEPIQVQHQLKFRKQAREFLAALDHGKPSLTTVATLEKSNKTTRN